MVGGVHDGADVGNGLSNRFLHPLLQSHVGHAASLAASAHSDEDFVLAYVDELDPAAPTVVFCAGGYRSSVAASVLRQAGFADVSDVLGGYGAWVELIPTSA